jgi:drug/metabolite transporter superfamily protein YnfA
MKLGTLKIPPAGRVMFFVFGVFLTWATIKDISRGFTRYGGVVNTRADDPFAYWAVVVTMTFVTVLFFCAALVRRKTNA